MATEKIIGIQDVGVGDNGGNRLKTAWSAEVDETAFSVEVEILGVAPILLHQYDPVSVEKKGKAKKGDAIKTTDDLESYVYRDENGHLGVAARCLKATLVNASKRFKDPSNPRASCMELAKAGIIVTPMVPLFNPKTKNWDMEHREGAVVNRSRVSRVRPAMKTGWSLTFGITSLLPTLITEERLYEFCTNAGLLVGLCDHRPDYGRFRVVRFERKKLVDAV